jgi:hypothetical protein
MDDILFRLFLVVGGLAWVWALVMVFKNLTEALP